ncbi:MAG: amino acid adenylation domain-containing protein [Phycisphaerales bacterium]|nr:amino acid adenylation domain-containing protein [Phycisphaerales bacterium]
MPRPETILSRFDAVVRAHADRVGVEGNAVSLTYRRLDGASRAVAAELARAGVGPGDYVPMLMGRSPAFIAGVLGILRLGAAYTPIDPESPAPRRRAMLEPLHAKACLVDHGVEVPEGLVAIRAAELLDRAITEAAEPSTLEGFTAPDPESPAYVMYTSGSTGEPKGVVVPHRAVVRLVVDADYAEFGPELRWGLLSAVAFDASTLEVWGALLNGGCCVVQEAAYPSLDELALFLKQRRVDCVWLTAALFNTFVDQHADSMGSLRQLLTGGERESVRHIRSFKERFPGVRIVHGYGPTENTTFSLCCTITEAQLQGDRAPIGRSIRGSTERIVEPGRFDHADEREQGELLVGGEGLALGYLAREDLTRDKFVFDSDGVRWYRTGDLVRRLEDGSVLFLGRLDRQVKIRGHRIEPDEVEAALNACPGVRQGAVLVRGETAEDRHLVGVYVPESGATEASVRACLEAKLPRSMIPGRLVAVREMPRGSTEKVDHKAIDQQIDELESINAAADTSGLTATEASLTDLIRSRLNCPGPIGRETQFASIGGHSLAAMRLCADIHGAFGVSPTPIEILKLQSVSRIASRIDEIRRTPAEAPSRQNARGTDNGVGDLRQRVLLESDRDPTGRAMLVHQAWVARPGIESERLRAAWTRLLERHEALRTGFVFEPDVVRRISHDPGAGAWFSEEGSLPTDSASVENNLPREVIETIGRRIAAAAIPVRLHAWRLADDASLIVAAYHHAAVDEWSLELIEAEFAELLEDREPDPAPGYDAFVTLEQRWLDERAADEIAERIAQTAPPPGPLPDSGPQLGVEFAIDAPGDIGRRIDALAASEAVSPAALVLSIFGRVLRGRYGDPGRWVMTPVSKRVRPELQRLVGCCLDMRIIDAATEAGSVQEQIRTAQGESVLPIVRVIQRLRELNPVAVGHATRFGFTYRVIDDAERRTIGRSLRPIAVPQLAARFGVALHVERRSGGTRMWLEASSHSVDRANLEAIAMGLVEAVRNDDAKHGVARERGPGVKAAPAPIDRATKAEPPHAQRTAEVLASLWADLLGSPPRTDRDFYASGGSSLKAMQLGAMIHDRTGLKLHVGEFLREPTFEGLLRWVREDPERPYALFKRREPSEGNGVMLAIPGSSGRAVDLHAFWSAYSEHEPSVERMIGCDLVTIANELPPDADTETIRRAFIDRAVQAAIDEAEGCTLRIMGYSLGGVIAFGVASALLERGAAIREIVLLDAYAPAYLVRSRQTIAAKINAKVRRGFRPGPAKKQPPEGGEKAEAPNRELWRKIHLAFASWTPPRLNVPAVLVQSATARQHLRPILHAKSNGLKPYLRGPFRTASVEVEHLKMLTTGAAVAAKAAAESQPVPDERTP